MGRHRVSGPWSGAEPFCAGRRARANDTVTICSSGAIFSRLSGLNLDVPWPSSSAKVENMPPGCSESWRDPVCHASASLCTLGLAGWVSVGEISGSEDPVGEP